MRAIMTSVTTNFSNLPNDCSLIVFSLATRQNPAELEKLGLVCREWQALQARDPLWEPVFNQHVEHLTYDIDLSSAKTFAAKAKLLSQTRLSDFLTIIQDGVKKTGHKNELMKDFNKLGTKYCIDKYDLTDLIKDLINKNYLESFAKLLLFKPKFDTNSIATDLFKFSQTAENRDHQFCLQLMIKLNYHLNRFFKTEIDSDPESIETFILAPLSGCLNEIKMTDYFQSGLSLDHHYELPTHKLPSRFIVKAVELFYSTGTFQVPRSFSLSQVSFKDEKLKKYIRQAPLSETDVENVFLGLLGNKETKLAARSKVPKSIDLSKIRQQVNALPIPKANAFSNALAKYDKA